MRASSGGPAAARDLDIFGSDGQHGIAVVGQHIIGDEGDFVIGQWLDIRFLIEARHQHVLSGGIALDSVEDGGDQVVGIVRPGCRVVKQGRVGLAGAAGAAGLVATGAIGAVERRAGFQGVVGRLWMGAAQLRFGAGGSSARVAGRCRRGRGHGRRLFEPGRDGRQIGLGHMLETVFHGFGHGACGLPLAGHAARAQVLHDLFVAPASDASGGVAADVGRMPRPHHAAAQRAFHVFGHQRIARCVATAAMRQGAGQIGSPVDLGVFRRVGRKALVVEKERIPHEHGSPDTKGEGQVGRRRFVVDGLHAVHEVGVQVPDILVGDERVGGVGHGRIKPAAVTPYPLAHRAGEIFQAVVADTRTFGRGDVAGVNRAQRALDGVAASEGLARRRPRMTGHAVRGDGQGTAALDPLRIVIGVRARRGQRQRQGQEQTLHDVASRRLAMAAAAFSPSAAMLSVLLTTLADGMAPPPGSQRLS